jgi:hypothetical protein
MNVDELALVVVSTQTCTMPGPERPVAQQRRRDDVPAGRLRDQEAGDLAAGQRAVREVPQRPLAAHRLVDALQLHAVGADRAEQRRVRGVDEPAGDLHPPVAQQLRDGRVARVQGSVVSPRAGTAGGTR